MKTYTAGQCFNKCALALMLMLHVPLLFAGVSSESLSPMPWPMQAGESVSDLSRLFYPKNKHMQQHFIADTIRLNHDEQPDLNPTAVFEQEHQILIPSIRQLSKKSMRKSARVSAAKSQTTESAAE